MRTVLALPRHHGHLPAPFGATIAKFGIAALRKLQIPEPAGQFLASRAHRVHLRAPPHVRLRAHLPAFLGATIANFVLGAPQELQNFLRRPSRLEAGGANLFFAPTTSLLQGGIVILQQSCPQSRIAVIS